MKIYLCSYHPSEAPKELSEDENENKQAEIRMFNTQKATFFMF